MDGGAQGGTSRVLSGPRRRSGPAATSYQDALGSAALRGRGEEARLHSTGRLRSSRGLTSGMGRFPIRTRTRRRGRAGSEARAPVTSLGRHGTGKQKKSQCLVASRERASRPSGRRALPAALRAPGRLAPLPAPPVAVTARPGRGTPGKGRGNAHVREPGPQAPNPSGPARTSGPPSPPRPGLQCGPVREGPRLGRTLGPASA